MANPPGPLPAYNARGQIVAPVNLRPAGEHYSFTNLDGEGRDEGDAKAAAALLRGEELPEAFADGDQDEDPVEHPPPVQEDEDPVEHAPPVHEEEDPARLGLAPYVGGAAVLIFLGAAGVITVTLLHMLSASPLHASGAGGFIDLSTDAASGTIDLFTAPGIRDITTDGTLGFAAVAVAATHAALALAAAHAVSPPHVRDPPRAQNFSLGAWAWGGACTFGVLFGATAATRAALRHALVRAPRVHPLGPVYRDLVADVHLGPLAWTRACIRLLLLLLACADSIRAALLLTGPRRARLAAAPLLLLVVLATSAAVLALGIP